MKLLRQNVVYSKLSFYLKQHIVALLSISLEVLITENLSRLISAAYVPHLVTENLRIVTFPRTYSYSLYNGLLQDITIFMCKVNFELPPKDILALLSDSPSSHSVRNTECFICKLI